MEKTMVERPVSWSVLNKRLTTNQSKIANISVYISVQLCLYIFESLQEECDKLVNATTDIDKEILSTLINDGVDMNAVVYEVCTPIFL